MRRYILCERINKFQFGIKEKELLEVNASKLEFISKFFHGDFDSDHILSLRLKISMSIDSYVKKLHMKFYNI